MGWFHPITVGKYNIWLQPITGNLNQLTNKEINLFFQKKIWIQEDAIPLLQAQGRWWMCNIHPAREQPKRKPPSLYYRETGVCTLGKAVQHQLHSSQMVKKHFSEDFSLELTGAQMSFIGLISLELPPGWDLFKKKKKNQTKYEWWIFSETDEKPNIGPHLGIEAWDFFIFFYYYCFVFYKSSVSSLFPETWCIFHTDLCLL